MLLDAVADAAQAGPARDSRQHDLDRFPDVLAWWSSCCSSGYPVAFVSGGHGTAICAARRAAAGVFDLVFLDTMPNRIFGIMNNGTLIAVPLFVFMGVTLERARIAEDLLETLSILMGRLRGGLGIAVILVGMLMAASTGIVGATVVTMGLLSLPTMLKRGYDPAIATGTITAAGTLGQIIPPSIILVLLGDVLASAYQQAQLRNGVFRPDTVSVGDLFRRRAAARPVARRHVYSLVADRGMVAARSHAGLAGRWQ